jgi:hypothetical protein
MLLSWGAAMSAQTPIPNQDLAAELAARIAATIPAGTPVSLSSSSDGDPAGDAASRAAFVADVAARLTTRGVRVAAEGDSVTAIRVGCGRNLRERSCVAEIGPAAGARERVMVTGALEGAARPDESAWFSLDLRPLFAHPVQLLDVALLGDRLLVLDVRSVGLYRRTANTWEPIESRAFPAGAPWPRDLRGRLRTAGDRFEAWLPGTLCTGTADPLTFTCAENQAAWPVGIENGGIERGRNHFVTPEGVRFYGVVALGTGANPRWLIAGQDGSLIWLDAARRAAGTAGAADDLAALRPACQADTTIVAVEHAPGTDSDTLRTYQPVNGRLVPAASPIALAGVVTALWSTPGADVATAIVRDRGAARYEALQIRVACGR